MEIDYPDWVQLCVWHAFHCEIHSRTMERQCGGVSYRTDFKFLIGYALNCKHESDCNSAIELLPIKYLLIGQGKEKGVRDMLGLIAAVLIVLWLLGFLAFHVSSGLIHVLLVIGIVMLLLHFFRGRSATV